MVVVIELAVVGFESVVVGFEWIVLAKMRVVEWVVVVAVVVSVAVWMGEILWRMD